MQTLSDYLQSREYGEFLRTLLSGEHRERFLRDAEGYVETLDEKSATSIAEEKPVVKEGGEEEASKKKTFSLGRRKGSDVSVKSVKGDGDETRRDRQALRKVMLKKKAKWELKMVAREGKGGE